MRLPILLQSLIHRFHKLDPTDACAAPSDAELLRRFVASHDEAAFEVLVWRHGGMVLGVCKSLLRNSADIEDAFQAIFLILVRKASSLRNATSLAAWLYKVTRRVAIRLRTQKTRRRLTDALIEDQPAPQVEQDDDTRAVLDHEIARLPAKYRQVVILCYLEGHTTSEVAALLGRPRGTILSWLAWARRRLAQRLSRCGIAPMAAFGVLAASPSTPAATLVASTVSTALRFAAGGPIPTYVAALTNGVALSMFISKWTWVTSAVALALLAGAGAVYWRMGIHGEKSQTTAQAVRPIAEPPGSKASNLALSKEKAEDVDDEKAGPDQATPPPPALVAKQKQQQRDQDKLQNVLEILRKELRIVYEDAQKNSLEMSKTLMGPKKQIFSTQGVLQSIEEERELHRLERRLLMERRVRADLPREVRDDDAKRDAIVKMKLDELALKSFDFKVKLLEIQENLKLLEKEFDDKSKHIDDVITDLRDRMRETSRKLEKLKNEID